MEFFTWKPTHRISDSVQRKRTGFLVWSDVIETSRKHLSLKGEGIRYTGSGFFSSGMVKKNKKNTGIQLMAAHRGLARWHHNKQEPFSCSCCSLTLRWNAPSLTWPEAAWTGMDKPAATTVVSSYTTWRNSEQPLDLTATRHRWRLYWEICSPKPCSLVCSWWDLLCLSL